MTPAETTPPDIEAVRAAARRIAPYAHRTPIARCASLDRFAGASLFFKCEHLQKAGAFKFRGACNAVMSLDDESAAAGVATHSSGNHGGALALAARTRGVRATVVMPRNANPVKRAAVEGYGATVVECDDSEAARERALEAVVAHEGAAVVHPFDDPRVIAGQGTAMLELFDQVPDLDLVVAPVGGGGLLSGTAIAAGPRLEVWGAEPAAADDAWRSLRAGRREPVVSPQTIADGLRTSLGEITFPVIAASVRGIALVEEQAIVEAMRLAWQRAKLLIEPSAAVALAAVLGGGIPCEKRRIGVILSGGNVDLDALPW